MQFAESAERPLVTMSVTGYRHERYVREAVAGVLAQTYSPLEVILSDDCSSDRTFAIMEEMAAVYRGPHQIRLNRNERNLGTSGHLSKLLSMTSGEIRIGSASDDISDPRRVEKIVEVFRKNPRAQCVWSNAQIIDAEGRDVRLFASADFSGTGACGPGPLSTVVRGPWILGATAAHKMTVWKVFGPLMEGIAQEDAAMAWRCRLLGDICYIPEALVKYRQHGENLFDYRIGSVATALGEAKAKSGLLALRRQAVADLKTARRKGMLGWRAFIYYTLANRQRYLADDMTRWAVNQDLSGWRAYFLRWAVEQPKRAMRAVDGRITQKILLPRS
jgi:glycosyltransferase involved in cell wall biosynthesis